MTAAPGFRPAESGDSTPCHHTSGVKNRVISSAVNAVDNLNIQIFTINSDVVRREWVFFY